MSGFWKSLFSGAPPTPEQLRQQELDRKKLQWREAFAEYGRKQFYYDLSNFYVKYADQHKRRLPTEYLKTVLDVIADIYTEEFPPELPDHQQERHLKKLADPTQAYTVFLHTFLDALIAFTKAFPPEALTPIETKPTTFTRLLPVFTDDKHNFLPEIQSAFYALKKQLDYRRPDFDAHGIFDWDGMVPFAWYEFNEPKPRFEEEYFDERDYYEREPIYGEPEERRAWSRANREFKSEQKKDKIEFERQQKQRKDRFERTELQYWENRKKLHDETHKELHSDALPWQMTFFRSPLWCHVARLVPNIYVPFHLPLQKRFGGHYIIAPSQRGKTTLMTAMLLHDIEQVMKDKASVVIIDPKGDLIDTIPRLLVFADNDKLIYVDPDDNIAINPLDLNAGSIDFTVEHITSIFSSFSDELTDTQETLLYNSVRALLLDYPDPTLDTLRALLSNGIAFKKGELVGPFAEFAKNHSDDDIRTFLCHDFNGETYSQTKDQVLRRLRSLSRNNLMRSWFTTKHNRLDIGKEIDKAKVIVINNSYNKLTPSGCEFMGRFFLAQIRAAGERRKSSPTNLPVYVYIDECDQVIKTDSNIETVIDKLASKKIALVAAHQRLMHFKSNEGTLDALLNCSIKMANARDDAEALAKRFPVHMGDKVHLAPSELRLPVGSFATYVSDNVPESVVIQVQKPHLAFMSESKQAAIRQKMRDRYGQPPSQPAPEPPPQPQEPKAAPQGGAQTPPPKADPKPGPDRRADSKPDPDEWG